MADEEEVLQSSSSLKDDKIEDKSDKSLEKLPKPKRVFSRFCNALLALVFVCLFIFSLVSFSSFSYVYSRVEGSSGGKCILNAEYGQGDTVRMGSDGSCRLGIGGEVVIALYCILSLAVMIIKIRGGWSMMSCFLVFELIAVILMTILSFCTSVVISVGFSLTCRSHRSQYDLGCDAATNNNFHFYEGMQVAEATAWIGFAVLVGITCFYTVCMAMYCYGRRQANKAKAAAKAAAM